MLHSVSIGTIWCCRDSLAVFKVQGAVDCLVVVTCLHVFLVSTHGRVSWLPFAGSQESVTDPGICCLNGLLALMYSSSYWAIMAFYHHTSSTPPYIYIYIYIPAWVRACAVCLLSMLVDCRLLAVGAANQRAWITTARMLES